MKTLFFFFMKDPHLKLITGPMFCGKTSELIKIANLYEVSKLNVQIFKHKLDDRYGKNIASHSGSKKSKTILAETIEELVDKLKPDTDVVIIDEGQFFDSTIIDACKDMVDYGRIVVVGALTTDFRDQYYPFNDGKEDMSRLILAADSITHLKALCTKKVVGNICGGEASRTQKFVDNKVAPYDSKTEEVGGTESYAPRCREHFQFYK